MRKHILPLFLTGVILLAWQQKPVRWKLDPSHSHLGFRVQHMGISEVHGTFHKWNVHVQTQGEDFSTAQIRVEIDAASIDTRNAKRDNHLRSCDFLCVEKYPKIVFESVKMEKIGENKYRLIGKLTMHGETHLDTLEVVHHGTVRDPWGNVRAGFSVKGTLDRYKWGIKYNNVLESGQLLIGRDVHVDAQVELIKMQ